MQVTSSPFLPNYQLPEKRVKTHHSPKVESQSDSKDNVQGNQEIDPSLIQSDVLRRCLTENKPALSFNPILNSTLTQRKNLCLFIEGCIQVLRGDIYAFDSYSNMEKIGTHLVTADTLPGIQSY